MDYKLTKENVTDVVNEYIENNKSEIKSHTERPWDPTNTFEEKYANKQFEIQFNSDHGISFVTNCFAYGGV